MNRLPSKAAIAARAETEAKELFFLTLYLFIVFSALVFLKSAIKEADGVHWGYWGFAAIKAILVAKFILIGRALHIGEGLRDRPLIWQTLYKAIAFTIFVAILSVIEEAAIGMGVHGKTFPSVDRRSWRRHGERDDRHRVHRVFGVRAAVRLRRSVRGDGRQGAGARVLRGAAEIRGGAVGSFEARRDAPSTSG